MSVPLALVALTLPAKISISHRNDTNGEQHRDESFCALKGFPVHVNTSTPGPLFRPGDELNLWS